MHGLPCSSLQYCFGAPADVSPEPAPHLGSEPSRIQPNASTSPVILTQPQAADLTEPQHQPAVSSQHTKTNGTRAKEPAPILHSSPISEGFPEEETPQEESPVQNTKYTHIPRPSIIRSPQDNRSSSQLCLEFPVRISEGPLILVSSHNKTLLLPSSSPHLFPAGKKRILRSGPVRVANKIVASCADHHGRARLHGWRLR
ncbi:hypothetical protein KOW79_003509 [Hemibagrus wyckioides]|uniref:Uncharacterized protein n=1 Tax=Hemibagrus wyckioides TaxID=337641 RepID=A0A9D3P4D3_9TELE|nr:hypothetical protein KOW79_003509 [Hemibagrus wyckioides]